MEYLGRSEVYEATPTDFPLAWGDAAVARMKGLHLGAFMERICDAAGNSDIYLGVKLRAADVQGLVGEIPMRFRCAAVRVEDGVLVAFALQFLDDPSNPLNSEHLIDPTDDHHLDLLSQMLSQKRWLLPIFDEVGNLVVVKLVRQSKILSEGFGRIREAVTAAVAAVPQGWERCQIAYDLACRPGHLF